MNKKTKYTINGALTGAFVKALINANKQCDAIAKNETLRFNWEELFVESAKGATILGSAGWIIGAIADAENDQVTPINTDIFLLGLASKVELKTGGRVFMKLDSIANSLIKKLKIKFAGKLKGEPMRLGSTEKGTALKGKYDIDICLVFKRGSFSSTKQMYETVLSFFKEMQGRYSIFEVRDQRKSIGVIVKVYGADHKIDFVPYKISADSPKATAGYLHVKRKSILGENRSYTKTDVHLLNKQRLSESQRRIIIILKHWKHKNELPLSSHLLEKLVLDAFQYHRNRLPAKFSAKVMMVFKHIAENLDVAIIKGVENTNNVLTDIPTTHKSAIIDACKSAIEEYEYQPNNIVNIFS